VDVPAEFYAENPPFNNPDELEGRLQGMEEDNLFLIGQCQDQRMFADAEVQKMTVMKGGIGNMVNQLEENYVKEQKTLERLQEELETAERRHRRLKFLSEENHDGTAARKPPRAGRKGDDNENFDCQGALKKLHHKLE
jgi:hypothetical protein